jgi:quercetin dioxygenase-like cupin family protein
MVGTTVLPPEELHLATLIQKPTIVEAAGQPPKSIEEFVGRVSSGTAAVSIARMKSPSGWLEPGQTPEFDEYTVVLRGSLHVQLRDTAFDVAAGQAIIVKAGEWVQYDHRFKPGTAFVLFCNEPGHYEQGEFVGIVVK